MLAAAAAALCLWLLLPKSYTASVLFRVTVPADSDAVAVGALLRSVRSELQSAELLGRVLAEPEISELAVMQSLPDRQSALAWLGRQLSVEPGAGHGEIEVTLDGPAATDLLVLLKGVAAAYLATRQAAEAKVEKELAKIRARRADAEARLNLTRTVQTARIRTPGASDRAALVRSRQELEKRLAQFREQLREMRQELSGMTNTAAASERQALESIAKRLQTRIDSLAQEIAGVNRALAEDDRQSQEVRRHEDDLAVLQKQVAKAQTQASTLPVVRVARAPECRRILFSGSLLALTGLPLGALCLVGWAVGRREVRPRRIRSGEDLTSVLGAPVLVRVPALRSAERQRFHGVLAPPDVSGPDFMAAIEAVRALLVRGAKPDTCRVVVVTSAGTGEGKSTLARHLAISLAQAGLKTLLIDADSQSPSVHRAFEQTQAPGLAELLWGEAGPSEAVRPTTTAEFLWLLPAGHWKRSTAGESNRPELLGPLHEEFPFIVVDAPPVFGGDALFLGGLTPNVTLLSVLRNVSQPAQVQVAWQRLSAGGVGLAGAVFQG